MSGRRPFIIRDPIHGYVRVAAHERPIVDHPITQRLRNVSQNGLAHLVYPEARTSRFTHSLGAMHLASRFLVSSVEHANADVMERVFAALDQVRPRRMRMDSFLPLMAPDPQGGTTLLSARAAIKGTAKERVHRRRLLAWAEAALRLAALYHDLGHLPFSHDLEFVLRDHVRRDTSLSDLSTFLVDTPHEEIGHRLARWVLLDLRHQSALEKAIYRLAFEILESTTLSTGGTSIKSWLHTLVDGELDVDRADYLLRDARAFGFEFAAYDLERIIENITVGWSAERGFFTAVREQGVGALESFFVSRARSHQMLVRHHKVAQVGAALRFASAEALSTAEGKRIIDLLNVLRDEGTPRPQRIQTLAELSTIDDGWWTGVLRQLRKGRRSKKPMLEAALSLVLDRVPAFESLWKRRPPVALTSELNGEVDAFFRDVESAAGSRMKSRVERLRRRGFLLSLHDFHPYRLETRPHPNATREEIARDEARSRMLVEVGGEHQPLARVSPLVRSLLDHWRGDVHLHAFARRTGRPRSSEARLLQEFLEVFRG
jgi:HD superfamily phosphohydrolase